MSLPGQSTTVVCLFCDGFSWVPCLYWTIKLPGVFQKDTPGVTFVCLFVCFKHCLHIWTLSNSDCMILKSIFSHWWQLSDSYTTITKDSNVYCWTWCQRGKNFWIGWRCVHFYSFFYHMSSREILLYMSMARGGLGQNFSPGNLTLIQAIPYTHNKLWNMDNPISLFVWPSHKKV